MTAERYIATETNEDITKGDILVEKWTCAGRWLTFVRESDGVEFDSEVIDSGFKKIENKD